MANVTREVFDLGLKSIVAAGKSAEIGLKHCAAYIATVTTYKEQQALKLEVSKAYMAFMKSIGNDLKLESAQRWVNRTVKAKAPKGFEWAKSDTPAAAKKRQTRTGKALKTGAPKEVKKPAQQQAMKKENWADEMVARVKNLETVGEMFIPAGKVEEFRAVFAAFLTSLEKVIK